MISSIQSVAGQPVAAPLSMPMHQAGVPSVAILSWSVLSSAHVVGTV